MKKINIKELVISIIIPIVFGILSSVFSGNFNTYQEISKPKFAPPGFIFPIVWFILFIFMGISSYLIYKSNSYDKEKSLLIYNIQLIVNFFWSIIFFRLKNYFLAFIWIILLLVLIIIMFSRFYKINKISAYLQIPYIIWVVFATILTYSIYALN